MDIHVSVGFIRSAFPWTCDRKRVSLDIWRSGVDPIPLSRIGAQQADRGMIRRHKGLVIKTAAFC